MEVYKVRASQNLFDVALHLYGNIEGLFDLLLSNPELNMTSELQPNQFLNYHKEFILNADIVQQLNEKGLVPVNGSREIEPTQAEAPLCILARTWGDVYDARISLSGEGCVWIDWGDGSRLECATLLHSAATLSHEYDAQKTNGYAIKIYGDPKLNVLDISELPATVYAIRNISCAELRCHGYIGDLQFVSLLQNLRSIDAQGSVLPNLAALNDCDFRYIDLSDVVFTSSSALTDFLQYRLENHYGKGVTHIVLSGPISTQEQHLIDELSSNDDFNEAGGSYVFTINNSNSDL